MQDYSPSFYSFSHSNVVVYRLNKCAPNELVSNTVKKYVKKYR